MNFPENIAHEYERFFLFDECSSLYVKIMANDMCSISRYFCGPRSFRFIHIYTIEHDSEDITDLE